MAYRCHENEIILSFFLKSQGFISWNEQKHKQGKSPFHHLTASIGIVVWFLDSK